MKQESKKKLTIKKKNWTTKKNDLALKKNDLALKQNLPLDHLSFVISTYNGWHLLQKNLPSIYLQTRADDEVLIADDASSDLTITSFRHQFNLELVEENEQYRLWRKKVRTPGALHQIWLTLLENKKNLRFGANNNLAVKLARYDALCLLNNDLILEKDWRQQALAGWRRAEKNQPEKPVFALTFLEKSARNPQEKKGRNELWFSRGRFFHRADPELKRGPTAWAGGGSSLFDRRLFLKLGGFDKIYYPAYWEDIDLSFQAHQAGYQVVFDPQVVVIHDHETTNQTVFGAEKIDQMSWQNGSKFLGKNATRQQKIQSWLWSPYWWIKRHRFAFGMIVILLVASFLRFYQLGQLPQGLTWDEAAIGYNGWAVWETRRDEWLTRLPISFRSFGDYKAPLAIYLNGAATHLLAKIDIATAVRLPFALGGVLGVWGMGLLVRALYREKKHPEADKLGLLATLIMALNPGQLFFSRVGFEANLALTLVIWGVYFWVEYWQRVPLNRQKSWQRFWLLALSGIFLALSLYTYHSCKVMVPLLILILILGIFKRFKFRLPQLGSLIVIMVIILLPLLKDSFYGQGLTRANLSFVTDPTMTNQAKISQIIANYARQLKVDFLAAGATGSAGLAHGTGKFGVLSWPTLGLVFFGLIVGLRQTAQKRTTRGIFWLGFWWLIIGLLPASIGDTLPHPVRALGALPGLIIIAVVGLEGISTWRKIDFWSQWTWRTFIILELIYAGAFWHYYTTDFRLNSSSAFNAQALEAMALTTQYAKQVDKIKFTDEYGQTYVYALLAKKINPIAYQGGALNKYELVNKLQGSDLFLENNALVVAGQNDYQELAQANIDNDLQLTPVATLTDEAGGVRYVFYLTAQRKNYQDQPEPEKIELELGSGPVISESK